MRPVVVGAAQDHRGDRIVIGHGLGQRLQDDQPDAVAAHEAVAARVEHLAPPVARHHVRLREADGEAGGQDDVDAAGERERALARPQALTGQVHGDQRGRARGVHGEARALEVERVGEAAGQHTARDAGDRVDVHGVEVARQHALVLGGARADEDAGSAARELLDGLPGVLQRFPGHLQEDALLGVHARGLARRDAEERQVEEVNVLQEGAPPRRSLARAGGARVVDGLDVEPLGGNLADGVHAVRARTAPDHWPRGTDTPCR